jgi:LmbE family N-acetylglucosaminyl deacetylase
MSHDSTRRSWLAAAGAGLPLVRAASVHPAISQPKLKIVVVGAHVDDPQAGCGGTMALYADLGHDVVAISLTRGDSISIARSLGMPNQELAARRSSDAVRSCRILGSRMIFLDHVNGDTVVDASSYNEFGHVLMDQQPAVVFTHWPIDTHRDHRAASLLTYDAWLRSGRGFALYFYEVELGTQTHHFRPNHYVEITRVEERKRRACFANALTVQGWWPLHETMQRSRGMEHGCKAAEAFVSHVQARAKGVPDPLG